MGFFDQEFTFTLSGSALFGILLVGGVSAISVFTVIVSLLKRIRNLTRPRYGFLGKPLLSLLLLSGIVGTITYFSYSFSSQPDFQIQASRTVDARISTQILQPGAGGSTVSFAAVPVVNGNSYGDASSKFDILWNITGPVSIDQFEYNRSRVNQSGFSEVLPAGQYNVRVVVVFDGKSYTFNQPLTVQ